MIYSIVGSGNLTPIPTTTPYPAPSGRTGAIVLDDILKMTSLTRGRRLSLEDKLGASQSFMKFAGSSSLNRIWNFSTRGGGVGTHYSTVDIGRRAGERDRK
jgi:hypothetical protein